MNSKCLRKIISRADIPQELGSYWCSRPTHQVRLTLECGHHVKMKCSADRYERARCEFCEEERPRWRA